MREKVKFLMSKLLKQNIKNIFSNLIEVYNILAYEKGKIILKQLILNYALKSFRLENSKEIEQS